MDFDCLFTTQNGMHFHLSFTISCSPSLALTLAYVPNIHDHRAMVTFEAEPLLWFHSRERRTPCRWHYAVIEERECDSVEMTIHISQELPIFKTVSAHDNSKIDSFAKCPLNTCPPDSKREIKVENVIQGFYSRIKCGPL